MSEAFRSSDEFDEQAHQLYNQLRYDEALEVLRDGLAVYPGSVELHVGMGYAYLAREDFLSRISSIREEIEEKLARKA